MSEPVRSLSRVLGQERSIAQLRGLLTAGGPVPPLLLHGPEGVGKRTAALGFAAALVCRRPSDADACGCCPSCQRVAEAWHVTNMRAGADAAAAPRSYPDIGLIGVPSGRTRISVLQARDVALSLASHPFALERRVYVIDPAESLTLAGHNALLKTLEEPPDYGVLIMITSAAWALPITVRSRLRSVRFGPLQREMIERILIDHGCDADDARARAALSRGSVARALELDVASQHAPVEHWVRLVESLAAGEPAGALAVIAAEQWGAQRQTGLAALEALLDVLRDVVTADEPRVLDEQQRRRLGPLAERWIARGLEAAELIDRLRREIVQLNRNPRLALEGAVLALAGHLRTRDLPG
ncbi:MAG: hypothetical protein JSV80_05420 [Acidobacteriota bacterium]|nr:MAG: hypothetical protein JSV80_05420 [Acidobacteriota bacterium]